MSRAISPVVGAPLLVGITVLLAAAVGVFAFGVSLPATDRPVVLSVSATAEDGRITLTHQGGPSLDVRDLTLRIEVDGTPLAHQPPVPFFSATGFRSGPTGPFNPSADPEWAVGERASLRVAGTNSPPLAEGATLVVRIYRGEARIAAVETLIE